ncbi:MAG: hypothetical protein V3T77_02950, partial [Planctomycetota bacterium]
MVNSRRLPWFLFLFFSALLLLPGLASAGPPQFRRGDADDSGCTDLIDAVFMLDALFVMGTPPSCDDAADANDDGIFNINDPVFLLTAIFIEGGAPVPPPGPADCGVDPTGDGLGCASYSCLPCGFGPPNPNYTLSLSSGAGLLGEQEQITASLTNNGDPIRGWSFGVCHDSAFLGDPAVVEGATVMAFNGGMGPDLGYLEIVEGEGWTVGLLISLPNLEVLPVGANYELYLATYPLLAETPGTTLSFCDNLSVNGFPIPVTIALASGAQETPVTNSGSISIGRPPEDLFIRGDMNGDGEVTTEDYDQLEEFLFGGVPPLVGSAPVGCDGMLNPEPADINDNEHYSVADLLLFFDNFACGAPLPEPSFCGADPTDDPRGFDVVDPAYTVIVPEVIITGLPVDGQHVEMPVSILSPAGVPVKAVQLGLGYGEALTPSPRAFIASMGIDVDAFGSVGNGVDTLVLTVGKAFCANMYVGAGTLMQIGSLHFDLEPFGIFPTVLWLPDVEINGVNYRATVVDGDYVDHHPFLFGGTVAFARGNANNSSGIDISDA